MQYLILLLLLFLGTAGMTCCEDCDGFPGPAFDAVLMSDFGGWNLNQPGLYGWQYFGPVDSPTFVKESPPGGTWSLSLESGSPEGIAWYDLTGLESGVYHLSVRTRVDQYPGGDVPIGKINLQSATTFKDALCGPDTMWHTIELVDTLSAGTAAIHLFGGTAQTLGSRVLFNEVTLLREN